MMKKKLLISLGTIGILVTVLQLTSINPFIFNFPKDVSESIFEELVPRPATDQIHIVNISGVSIKDINRQFERIKDLNAICVFDYCGIELTDEEKTILMDWQSQGSIIGACSDSFLNSSIVNSDMAAYFDPNINSFEIQAINKYNPALTAELRGRKGYVLINYQSTYSGIPIMDFDFLINRISGDDVKNKIILFGNLGNQYTPKDTEVPDLSGEKNAMLTPITYRNKLPDMFRTEVSGTIMLTIINKEYIDEYDLISNMSVLILVCVNLLLLNLVYRYSVVLYWIIGYVLLALESFFLGYLIIYFFDTKSILLDFSYAQILLVLGIVFGFFYKIQSTDRS